MLKKEVSNMAIIKGDSVENATTYELYEVTGGGYSLTFAGSVEELSQGDLGSHEFAISINDGAQEEIISGTYEGVSTFSLYAIGGNGAQFIGAYEDGTDFDSGWLWETGGGEGFTLTQNLTITAIYK